MAKCVLIVDDEEWICSVLQDYLEESGYHVRTASTLSLARDQMALSELPDIVVADMSLPDGSGIHLLGEIRNNDRTKTIPFILITAHSPLNVENSTVAMKPDDCILKPFNLREFKSRLDRQLQ